MAVNTSDIKSVIQTWLKSATGLDGSKIIWAYQNGPEPEGQFITVNPILSIQRIGQDEQITDQNGNITTRARRSIITQIDVYGSGALEQASAAYDALSYPLVHAAFVALSLSADQNSVIRNLTALKNGQYESRASFDVRISAVYDNLTLADDLGWFNQVEYSGVLKLAGFIPKTTVTGV